MRAKFGGYMAEYWVIYRDVEDSEPRQSFEVMAAPEADQMVIRDGVLPGMAGLKDLHIKWHHRQLGPDAVHLVTYTHVALKAHEVKDLVTQAYRFAQERN